MVYVCLLYAGKFSEPQQPYAAMQIPALYGRDKGWCMIPGHRTADCPVNATYDGMYWPQESVHLEETRWCSTEKVVKSWQQTAKGMKAVWGEQKFQGTCCHYPATAEVWEARYVQVNIYDEDNWNSNDLLGSVEVDLRELSELAHFQSVDHDYDVQELNVKGRPNGDLFTVKVRVAWEHPTEHAVSTVFDTKPLDWDPYGVSLSSANAPWETHGFSPPPPFHCDCSWTATWSCPDDEKGSEGFAKPDGSKCFEYCCPPEVYGELAAERTADVSHHMASVASAWVAFPIILVIALIVVVMRFGMRARDAQAQGLPSTGPITANML